MTRSARFISISIHAPLAGCDVCLSMLHSAATISIHAPLAGCDNQDVLIVHHYADFNPRTPCGVRLCVLCIVHLFCDFNPRTPCGVRPYSSKSTSDTKEFQSTHPLRGATVRFVNDYRRVLISIHAPLAGCDGRMCFVKPDRADFNPRTPCGVRLAFSASTIACEKFQSTHPLRGATAKLPKYSRQICAKATKFLQSRTKSGVAACWAKGRRLLFPTLRGANLPGKTRTLPVRIR